MTYDIREGDCLSVMAAMPDASVDSIVSDPPYGLEFMGKAWDAPWKQRGENPAGAKFSEGGFKSGNGYANRKTPTYGKVWSNKRCTKCGHIASGGSPCRCETPEWVVERGDNAAPMRGFQEWATEWAAEALRVAKPGAFLVAFGGSRTYHRLTCAIEDAGWEIRDCLSYLYGSGFPKSHNGPWGGTALKPAWEPIILARKPLVGTVAVNVAQHGTGGINVDGCRIATDEDTSRPFGSTALGQGSGWNAHANRDGVGAGHPAGRWPANVVLDEEAAGMFPESRFFYTAKASRKEREAGLEGMPRKAAGMMQDDAYEWKGTPDHAPHKTPAAANHHPTVKPIALMRWLCRLVTPPNGVVLDPFTGSGTTGCAAVLEGFRFVGIEREAEYVEIARKRVAHWAGQVAEPDLFADAK